MIFGTSGQLFIMRLVGLLSLYPLGGGHITGVIRVPLGSITCVAQVGSLFGSFGLFLVELTFRLFQRVIVGGFLGVAFGGGHVQRFLSFFGRLQGVTIAGTFFINFGPSVELRRHVTHGRFCVLLLGRALRSTGQAATFQRGCVIGQGYTSDFFRGGPPFRLV